MEKITRFEVTEALFKLAGSHDCSEINYFPGVYGLVYAMSFGGCGRTGTEINGKIRELGLLNKQGLIIAGINPVFYPFIITGIHKSIIFGGMKYTDKLIVLARMALSASGYYDEDEWLKFYNKVYLSLSGIADGSTNPEHYPVLLTLISDGINCNGKENVYKCKVLATLGDLEKYDEIRYTGTGKAPGLLYAIDKDLEYVSKKFGFDRKLEEYKGALERKISQMISYYITGKFMKESYDEYVKEKRVVPVLLLNRNINRGQII
jgi:hypothetical protein